MEIIEANKKQYMKKFKRSIFKERVTFFLEMIFAFSAGAGLFVALFI